MNGSSGEGARGNRGFRPSRLLRRAVLAAVSALGLLAAVAVPQQAQAAQGSPAVLTSPGVQRSHAAKPAAAPAAAAPAGAAQGAGGIQIVDLATGKTLYELNPGHYFVPASNAKLFSTALALSRLGADFTFQTRVLAPAPPDELGRIRGSLRLAGGGDPNLSARPVPYRMGPVTGNPLTAIEDLAGQLVARGVKRVDGDIIGDDTWYVWQP